MLPSKVIDRVGEREVNMHQFFVKCNGHYLLREAFPLIWNLWLVIRGFLFNMNSCSEIQHKNVIKFIGAGTKPKFYLVTGKICLSECSEHCVLYFVYYIGNSIVNFNTQFILPQNICLAEICMTLYIYKRPSLLFHLCSK